MSAAQHSCRRILSEGHRGGPGSRRRRRGGDRAGGGGGSKTSPPPPRRTPVRRRRRGRRPGAGPPGPPWYRRQGGRSTPLRPPITEAYDAALDSISGQYQLWDEAAGDRCNQRGHHQFGPGEPDHLLAGPTTPTCRSLTERSADIEGLSEMIATFADGSEDSVNAIAGMAGATDEQLAAMVSQLAGPPGRAGGGRRQRGRSQDRLHRRHG